MLALAGRIPPGVLAELAKLGPAAAPLVAKLVGGTKAQLDEFAHNFVQSTESGVVGMTDSLVTGFNLAAVLSQQAGSKVAKKYADAIRAGKITVDQAVAALQGSIDKDTLQVTLGLKNKADIEAQLDKMLNPRVYQFQPWVGPGGQKGFKVGSVYGYEKGGWVRGGSGREDDVSIGRGLYAMGGEFMVEKRLAQANKPFFDYLDRYGHMPQMSAPAPAAPVVHVHVKSDGSGPTATRSIGPIVMQPGWTMTDLVNEIDRREEIDNRR